MGLLFFGFDDGEAAPADDDLPAWFAFVNVWQLPWLTDTGTIDGADLQEMWWNVRSPLYDEAAVASNSGLLLLLGVG